MTDNERAELWKQLKAEQAKLYDRQAMGENVWREMARIDVQLHSLKEAESIRALLAKIENIGEP
jgi:hypothetical protein